VSADRSAATTDERTILLVPGDVEIVARINTVEFEGSRNALRALAGNLRRLAITIERRQA